VKELKAHCGGLGRKADEKNHRSLILSYFLIISSKRKRTWISNVERERQKGGGNDELTSPAREGQGNEKGGEN